LFWGEQPPFTPIGVGGGNFLIDLFGASKRDLGIMAWKGHSSGVSKSVLNVAEGNPKKVILDR